MRHITDNRTAVSGEPYQSSRAPDDDPQDRSIPALTGSDNWMSQVKKAGFAERSSLPLPTLEPQRYSLEKSAGQPEADWKAPKPEIRRREPPGSRVDNQLEESKGQASPEQQQQT